MQPKVRQLSFRLLSILSIGAYRLLVEGLVIIRHQPMGTGDQIIDIVDVFTVLVIYSVFPCSDGINFDEFIIGFGRQQIRTGYSLRWDLVPRGVHKTVPLLRPFLKIVNHSQKYRQLSVNCLCTWKIGTSRLFVEVTLGSCCFLRGTGDQKINNFYIFVVFPSFMYTIALIKLVLMNV